ncbi:hypothetical protein OH491_16980 [Termitidicoccus mucosus]|uniref:Uncharacterized protein n=1 Tax=Termitidicoccus mucosus TaxID=1184151 RepID=A0A178IKX2_9BACT|nr:hypothetical protein AW736_11610 [Opitutaceae bacterium TSB47]
MRKQQQAIFIWDKVVYYSTAKGWARTAIERVEDAAAIVQEHCKRDNKIMLLYDPETLQTEYSECPGGGRAIVREVLAGSHESLNNPHTAWGFQTPWQISAAAGGNQGTFCSFETVPSLYLLNQTLYDLKYPVSRCFSFASLAMFSGTTPGRTNVFLVVDKDGQAFVYLNTAAGLRAARKVSAGKREDFDVWSEISLIFGEYGVTFEDGGMRPVVRLYQAPGTDAKTQCPYWETLAAFGQVELHNFSVLATLLASIPSRHSSSLIEDLPKNISLNLGLKIGAAVLAAILLGGGSYAYNDLSKDSREIRSLETLQSSLATQKTGLERNKREIEEFLKLYANDRFDYSHGHLQLLQALGGAIPRDATLLNISIGVEAPSKFRLNGIFWNQKVSMSKQTGSTAVNNVSPVTPITRHLESSVQGLLVAPNTNSFNSQTGDFVLEGNTPRPEGVAAATPASAPPPARRPPATSGRR